MKTIIIAFFFLLIPVQALSASEALIRSVFRKAGVSAGEVRLELADGYFMCGNSWSQACLTAGQNPKIRITESLSDTAFEFSLLHELGHYATYAILPRDQWEYAADRFAAERFIAGKTIALDLCSYPWCWRRKRVSAYIPSFAAFTAWRDSLNRQYRPAYFRFANYRISDNLNSIYFGQ